MAKRACPFCREKVQSDATICKHCKSTLPPLPPQPWWHGGRGVILVIFIIGIIGSFLSKSPEQQPAQAIVKNTDLASSTASSSKDNNCRTYPSKRSGWLLDHDRRGEVVLWKNPSPPFADGNKIAFTVVYPNMPAGESMITDVTKECLVDGIIYYYIEFDERRKGWVDVDYLHWKKVRR